VLESEPALRTGDDGLTAAAAGIGAADALARP